MADDLDLPRFATLIRERSGMNLEGTRLSDLRRGIVRALQATGLARPADLYRLLADREQGGRVFQAVVAEIAIGETHFFRHSPQMEMLERHVLPDLVERRRDRRRLRIWSAGCSTGEEPYSLAILLRRALPDLTAWDAGILATDIDEDALASARRGVYGPWSFRGVPPGIEEQYFLGEPGQREVLPAVRELVTFEYLNLAEDPYPSLLNQTAAVDLIVCRNVFIYFDAVTRDRAAAGFFDALTEGGWLLVGPAEPCSQTFERFEVHNLPGGALYRKPAGGPLGKETAGRDAARDGDLGSIVAEPRANEVPTRPRPTLADPILKNDVRARADPVATDETSSADEARRLASSFADRLELEPALRWVETAIERDPLLAAAHYLRGLILQEQGREPEALEALRRSVYSDPGFALGHFAMAGLLEASGHRERALKALDSAVRLVEPCRDDEPLDGGDGLTAGRLRQLASLRRKLWR